MNSEAAPLAAQILQLIHSEELLETGEDFTLDCDLFEAGLDSMAIMQLTLLLEREFGVSLPQALIVKNTFSSARNLAQVLMQLGVKPA